MHRNLVEVLMCGFRDIRVNRGTDRQTDSSTYRHGPYNTPLPYAGAHNYTSSSPVALTSNMWKATGKLNTVETTKIRSTLLPSKQLSTRRKNRCSTRCFQYVAGVDGALVYDHNLGLSASKASPPENWRERRRWGFRCGWNRAGDVEEMLADRAARHAAGCHSTTAAEADVEVWTPAVAIMLASTNQQGPVFPQQINLPLV